MKNNIGLVKYAEMALKEKWGYVWGTYGQVLTRALYDQKLKQYPSGVGNYASFILSTWLNRKTADCVGLIKSYIWFDEDTNKLKYNGKYDVTADMMYDRAKVKGKISTIPEVPGICLWFKGHIGIYIGKGWVIEAKGTKYGVVKTKLADGRWTHWLECPYIDYLKEEVKPKEPIKELEKEEIKSKEITVGVNDLSRVVNVVEIKAANGKGENFIRLRDLEGMFNIDIDYDEVKKQPILKDKKTKIFYKGKSMEINNIKFGGINHLAVKGIVELLIGKAEIKWDEKTGEIEII